MQFLKNGRVRLGEEPADRMERTAVAMLDQEEDGAADLIINRDETILEQDKASRMFQKLGELAADPESPYAPHAARSLVEASYESSSRIPSPEYDVINALRDVVKARIAAPLLDPQEVLV